ncbi:lysophospholipid acyltransferase family protein [Dyadobacter aurulentus]|uniref:lysophospholipid acyltransferase family protein n=1 Tax=Dyadobacter sp. UC 10 TaxID=2605428 RepID=UPI0011F3B841|nr:lysophospholipid acyltransferase family protein [Dyadobacter sp. UC 10]KAA0993544.1 lysophospholipid acyltransferase family protein [Dyadobacter sp. UC 10]
MITKKVTQLVAYELCYAILFFISLLPMKLLYGISSAIFYFSFYVVGYRRLVAIQNISRSFPEKKYTEIQHITKKFYKHFASYLVENIKAISAPVDTLNQNLVFENIEILDQYISAGQDVIVCLGHCANWEVLNLMSSNTPHPVYAVYKPLKSPIIDSLMKRVRSRFGMRLISDASVTRHILSKKSGPAIYLFLADQCPSVLDNRYKFDFLHQETYFFSGMEKLARLNQSAVVYLHVTGLSRGGYYIKCKTICQNAASTDAGEVTRKYAELLAEGIRENPSSWLWTHRRWKK